MVISETKLKNINYNITSIKNYHFHSSNSPTNSGGIGIYLKTSLNYKIRPDLCLNEDLVEDIWVEIKSNNCNKARGATLCRGGDLLPSSFLNI